MERPAEQQDDPLADTIRRTIRLLGAQPTGTADTASIVKGARFIFERLRRADIPVRWIDDNPNSPLVIAGQGPVGITTYLDDSHPHGSEHGGDPPAFEHGIVRAPGIKRKAGVVAAVSTLLAFPDRSADLTVVIETDRHSGSHAIERWLEVEPPHLTAVAWEVADLPLNPPLLARSATGRLTVRVEFQSTRQQVENVYGAVLPDIGFALASALSTLKTADSEVRLGAFYDGIISPNEADFEALMRIAPGISSWLEQVASGESDLPTSHLTLGMFCAPSITLRDLQIEDGGPYLPARASASIEFQLVPGQSVQRTLDALTTHFQQFPFTTTITPLLNRPPSLADETLVFGSEVPVLPIAPGPSPASLFGSMQIPCAGFAVVGRRADRLEAGISLESIAEGSRFLLALAESLNVPHESESA